MEEKGSTLKRRIKEGRLRREDVLRRLAELAFGQPNDCVRLALEEIQDLKGLDLSLLSEIKRSDKGMMEIRLIDRVKVLERLEQAMDGDGDGMGELRRALGSGEEPGATPGFPRSSAGPCSGGSRAGRMPGSRPSSAMGRCAPGRPWPWGWGFSCGPSPASGGGGSPCAARPSGL